MRWLRGFWCVLVGLACVMQAKGQAVPEYTLKATYLYNFMVFADWPRQAEPKSAGPMLLCVLGPDSFGSALSNLEGKNINGRKLAVVRLKGYSELKSCHLLFITEREAPNMNAIQNALGDAPVLTVADTPVAVGSAILLTIEGSRLVFDINMPKVKRAGLALSSKVLQLARSTGNNS